MRHRSETIGGDRRERPTPPPVPPIGTPRCEREVRELEARLRNPWRTSKGREGALEAWG
jgi:hypothetical protein